MSPETSSSNPEKKEILDDNARKFITSKLSSEFLENNASTSYVLTTGWLETNEESEDKLAYKKYQDGTVQILHIKKVTKDGRRTAEKEKITQEVYESLLADAILRVEKTRYEFEYAQNDTLFAMKYDEFAGSELNVLEVDAANDTLREVFDPVEFSSDLREVTGDLKFYGYRVASVL